MFSEPTTGLSLETISNSDVLERKEEYTDESAMISEVRDIDEDARSKFELLGYERLSDIANTDIRQISNEINLPWQAIKEVKHKSQGHQGFSLNPNEEILERVSQDEAVETILNNKLWVSIFLFEYVLRSECERRAEEILEDGSKKDLVENMCSSTSRGRSYEGKIAKFTGCSENYVKDVLSGRIENGLTESERDDILDRDNRKCRMCDSQEDLEVHHVIPVSQGGSKEDDNLCTLCNDCHIEIAHDGKTSKTGYESKKEFWNIVESSS